MTTQTNSLVVVSVGWDAVTVAVNGENRQVAWDVLRDAARQDEPALAAAYAGVLADARRMVADAHPKAVRVGVHNYGGGCDDLGGATWGVSIRDMAGDHVSARIVGVEYGLTGSRSHAIREAREAVDILRQRGYSVRS